MAAGTLPAPGTELGPCKDGCQHIDCGMMRREADQDCRLCGKPIGFETRYYKDPDPMRTGGVVHARCLEAEIEQESRSKGRT